MHTKHHSQATPERHRQQQSRNWGLDLQGASRRVWEHANLHQPPASERGRVIKGVRTRKDGDSCPYLCACVGRLQPLARGCGTAALMRSLRSSSSAALTRRFGLSGLNHRLSHGMCKDSQSASLDTDDARSLVTASLQSTKEERLSNQRVNKDTGLNWAKKKINRQTHSHCLSITSEQTQGYRMGEAPPEDGVMPARMGEGEGICSYATSIA